MPGQLSGPAGLESSILLYCIWHHRPQPNLGTGPNRVSRKSNRNARRRWRAALAFTHFRVYPKPHPSERARKRGRKSSRLIDCLFHLGHENLRTQGPEENDNRLVRRPTFVTPTGGLDFWILSAGAQGQFPATDAEAMMYRRGEMEGDPGLDDRCKLISKHGLQVIDPRRQVLVVDKDIPAVELYSFPSPFLHTYVHGLNAFLLCSLSLILT